MLTVKTARVEYFIKLFVSHTANPAMKSQHESLPGEWEISVTFLQILNLSCNWQFDVSPVLVGAAKDR